MNSTLTNKTLFVNWKPPNIVPQCVRYYVINITFENELIPIFRTTNDTQISISNFPLSNYTLLVQAEGEDFLMKGDEFSEDNYNTVFDCEGKLHYS